MTNQTRQDILKPAIEAHGRPQSREPIVETESEINVPLCVDLDGTLIRSDALWESVVQLFRHPIAAARAFLALLFRGKAAFKTVLSEEIRIDPASLPYRQDVLAFVESQRAMGREIILATATHGITANRIADHLGLFHRVFATDERINLSGIHKLAALQAAFGRRGFDYIGDHWKDLPIFRAARKALLVNPSRALIERASAGGNVSRIFSENRSTAELLVRTLRLHQWAKNVLLAVPLLAAHMVLDPGAWIGVLTAFFALGLVASATYVVNDLVDLQSDRAHLLKRFRPLASGHLSIPTGLVLAVGLAIAGFAISLSLLPFEFLKYLVSYIALTLAYSFYLKQQLLVDVLALSILYTLRILAGGAVVGVIVSEWLLMFSLFIFLSLAFLKRSIELMGNHVDTRVSNRGYSAVDMETIKIIGMSSGLISVLVLTLYIGSPAVTQLYRSPQMLWLVTPLLIYWISRIWFMAARGQVHHDPIVFALLDRKSYVVGSCALVILVLAKIET